MGRYSCLCRCVRLLPPGAPLPSLFECERGEFLFFKRLH